MNFHNNQRRSNVQNCAYVCDLLSNLSFMGAETFVRLYAFSFSLPSFEWMRNKIKFDDGGGDDDDE